MILLMRRKQKLCPKRNPQPWIWTMQLSFLSFKGWTSNKSIKVWGEILGKPMIILIDSRATYNFLSKTIVEELKQEIAKYTMEVGNGQLEIKPRHL